MKGVAFDSWRKVGPVLPAIRVYNQRQVDELILLNIDASIQGSEPKYVLIREYSRDCGVPLTIGGGISRVEHVQKLLESGADKVSLNTAAHMDPSLITRIANRHGNQCIIGSIDVRRDDSAYCWHCYSESGTKRTGRSVIDWARECEDRGVGEILLTSIDRDGTMQGYDLALIEKVVSCVSIPVIASGGAGNYQHMIDAVKDAGAAAVAAASMFHFTELTPAGARAALERCGIPVRRTVDSLIADANSIPS